MGTRTRTRNVCLEEGELNKEGSMFLTSTVCTKSYLSVIADATHYDHFRCKGEQLYFKGKDELLTSEDGKLKTFGKLKSIIGKNRIHNLGFEVLMCLLVN